jgi:hydrogenase-4 component E
MMLNMTASQSSLLLETVVFTTSIFLHLVKKNATAVRLYMAQSAAISLLLLLPAFDKSSKLLLIAIIATIAVKTVVAPWFFFGLIKKHKLKFSVTTYLNTPLTLIVIAALVAFTRTDVFRPLAYLAPVDNNLLLLSLSAIMISFFLIINRKGALSQMIGMLSLENGIVSFAVFAGLEQNPALQLGITFNILIWIIIATVFVSMIYRQFGSLDVTAMQKLKE